MTWALVVVGGSAVLGAGASYAGSKKQAGASKAAAGLNMDQFRINNAQQQPFIQSGYGGLSKLNTLLGINPNPNAPRMSAPIAGPQQSPGSAYAPTPGGGVRPVMQADTQAPVHQWNIPEAGMGNLPLARILSLRAQHGDRQAQAMLQRLS
jgi:hypothetical protein